MKYVARCKVVTDIGPHASYILGTITAPSLQSFTIETAGYSRFEPMPAVGSSLLSGIKGFFEHSKFRLRRFSLCGVLCSTQDLLHILEIMSELRELVLHEVPPLGLSEVYDHCPNELVTTELIKSLTIDLNGDVLLPQLQNLELRILQGWEHDVFERMLESRCGHGLTSVYVAGARRTPLEREDFLVDIEKLGKIDLAVRVPKILEYEVIER
ncbi:hypothetical protein VNI00_017381 [Paramarasmius palmivorus]|uniref:Uncharacterized protein n=1 Tax=Paramarasmius palmivorus TaxID=297713 RepID=A0AAW0B6S9_9AGAR